LVFFIVLSIAVAVNLIGCDLMLPEASQVEQEVFLDEEMAASGNMTAVSGNVECRENETQESPPPVKQSLRQEWIDRSFTFRKHEPGPHINPIELFFQPFTLLLTPQVLATTLVFGLNIGWTASISIVTPNVYEQPTMLWKSLQVGLFGFGPFIGLSIALPLGGLIADILSMRASKRADGEHDPRSRLPTVILGGLISPTGGWIIGFRFQRHYHWIVNAIGWAMLAFGLTESANVLLTYSVDCFRLRAGHIGVIVNVVKNVIGAGVSFATMPWYSRLSRQRSSGPWRGYHGLPI